MMYFFGMYPRLYHCVIGAVPIVVLIRERLLFFKKDIYIYSDREGIYPFGFIV